MQKVFIANVKEKVLVERPAMEKPSTEFNPKKIYSGLMEDKRYLKHLASLTRIPAPFLTEEHRGLVMVELDKDFKIEEQFWEGTSWWPVKHLIDGKVKEGTKTRIIAVPITPVQQEEVERGHLFTYDDMMDIAGWMAAADNKRPIAELKEEAEVYIKARKIATRTTPSRQVSDAVEFAEWIREQNYKPYAGSWYLNGNNYAHQPHSTYNLWELFLSKKKNRSTANPDDAIITIL